MNITSYLCKYTNFRRPGWTSIEYGLFWSTLRSIARTCRWYHGEKNCRNFGWLYNDRMQYPEVFSLHNFLVRYERHVRDVDSPLAKQLRNCNVLKTAKNAQWSCQQTRVCPFCRFDHIALPLCERIVHTKDALLADEDARLLFVNIKLKHRKLARGPQQTEMLYQEVLEEKKRLQHVRLIRQMPNKWFVFLLLGDCVPSLKVTCNMLMLITKEELEDLKEYLRQETMDITCYGSVVPATRQNIRRELGRVFAYPKWMLNTPLSEISEYLSTPIFTTRIR